MYGPPIPHPHHPEQQWHKNLQIDDHSHLNGHHQQQQQLLHQSHVTLVEKVALLLMATHLGCNKLLLLLLLLLFSLVMSNELWLIFCMIGSVRDCKEKRERRVKKGWEEAQFMSIDSSLFLHKIRFPFMAFYINFWLSIRSTLPDYNPICMGL